MTTKTDPSSTVGVSLVHRPFPGEKNGLVCYNIPRKVGIPDILGFYPFIKPYSTRLRLYIHVSYQLHRILSQHISPSRIQYIILRNLTRMHEQIVPGRFFPPGNSLGTRLGRCSLRTLNCPLLQTFSESLAYSFLSLATYRY